LRQSRTLHTLTFGPISGVHFKELGAQITRDAYTRGAKEAHTLSSAAEVRQLKMWVDAVLSELLAIHK
jgi:hypothetical protein